MSLIGVHISRGRTLVSPRLVGGCGHICTGAPVSTCSAGSSVDDSSALVGLDSSASASGPADDLTAATSPMDVRGGLLTCRWLRLNLLYGCGCGRMGLFRLLHSYFIGFMSGCGVFGGRLRCFRLWSTTRDRPKLRDVRPDWHVRSPTPRGCEYCRGIIRSTGRCLSKDSSPMHRGPGGSACRRTLGLSGRLIACCRAVLRKSPLENVVRPVNIS